ncbi:hypothetical protein, partial [Nocardia brasiliensis]|uniref:hypothetical protein n=1 Tax=Nocardia brasiliensis TaxID=37326 RepID=UPI002457CD6C
MMIAGLQFTGLQDTLRNVTVYGIRFHLLLRYVAYAAILLTVMLQSSPFPPFGASVAYAGSAPL